MAQTHADRMAQIEMARNTILLQSGQQLFDSLAGAAEAFAGKQSGIYKAMFLASKAFAIADATIKIQQGIAAAAALPFPANLPAMASVAAATAGIVSAISSVGMSFDGGGYTGNGSRTGGLDGKGGFLAMMHPQETVIDHTKGQSMGGTVINIIESKDRAGTQQQRQGADGREEVDVFVADIMGDGKRARALQAAFGLQRRGA